MANYYINADSGNDTTGSGTSVAPWKTITKAISGSASNDTIFLQAATATYPWTGTNVTITPRTFIGDNPLSCVVDHGSAAFNLFFSTAGGAFNFTNLTFQNATAGSTFGNYVQATQANVTIDFTGCMFKNINTGTAFSSSSSSTGCSINYLGCLFYNLTANFNFNNAIIFTNFATASIINCTVYSNVATAVMLYVLGTGAVPVTLKNNIFYTVNAEPFVTGTTPTLTSSANNCVVGYTSVPSMTGTITSDPLFVDASSLNFNLRPTSPCIDAGVII